MIFGDLVYFAHGNRDGGNDTAELSWLLLDLSCFYFLMSYCWTLFASFCRRLRFEKLTLYRSTL